MRVLGTRSKRSIACSDYSKANEDDVDDKITKEGVELHELVNSCTWALPLTGVTMPAPMQLPQQWRSTVARRKPTSPVKHYCLDSRGHSESAMPSFDRLQPVMRQSINDSRDTF